MYFKISVILVLLQVTWIQGRTAVDVIQDFEPAFLKIHNQLYALENSTRSSAKPIFEKISSSLENQSEYLNQSRTRALERIEKSVWRILEETGMVDHVDLVQHCISTLRERADNLISTSDSEENLCYNEAQKQNYTIALQLYVLLIGFTGEHTTLEFTKQICSQREDPFDVQECLIYDLYGFYPSYIVFNINQIRNIIEYLDTIGEETVQDSEICYETISKAIDVGVDETVNEFRECVEEATPKTRKLNLKLKVNKIHNKLYL